MDNTHICLICKTEQSEPTNPLEWCIHCQAPYFYIIETEWYNWGEGYLCFFYYEPGVSDNLSPKLDIIVYGDVKYAKLKNVDTVIHCDNVYYGRQMINALLGNVNECNFIDITKKQMDYIKNIENFKDGRFYFKS